MLESKHLKRVKMKRNIKGLYRILMSSVGEGASLAAAVITDGLATLAAVVLQKNIFIGPESDHWLCLSLREAFKNVLADFVR